MDYDTPKRNVTPHTGVWIETEYLGSSVHDVTVTPHTGVWIETIKRIPSKTILDVTPHTGVWIETRCGKS